MFRRVIAFVVCLAILNVGSPLVAQAAVIGTLQASVTDSRTADLGTVNATLARAEVRQEMLALGIDPTAVEARIAGLTDPELRMLADRMADVPAGGSSALAVIGIVFLVLLILEAVGVIDIFKKFP